MNKVTDQYEAYPYPARNPADEAKRLILGSPSHPHELDHYLFAGKRDWSVPLRVLIAGGGTGDGLIQLATLMTAARRPYEITYVDLSTASRAIAEKRAKVRGLTGIRFVTGSLLDAPKMGVFDYIDCCGVLHHLPDPNAGFAALSAALATGGGLGFMVYAPLGRAGVYPLQEAFEVLYGDLDPEQKLKVAKEVYQRLPEGHVFKRNPHLRDHENGDAGFYDLLLHAQDRPYDVTQLTDALNGSGLEIVNFVAPAAYDLGRLVENVPENLGRTERMALAEKLCGTMKVHVGYAVRKGDAEGREASYRDLSLVPHLDGLRGDPKLAAKLAGMIKSKGAVQFNTGGSVVVEPVPKTAAKLVAGINGRRTLAEMAKGSRLDPIAFSAEWASVDRVLRGWGKLWYSGV